MAMLKSLIQTLLLAYVAVTVFAYFFADRSIFIPPRSGYRDTNDIIKLKTAHGSTISAVYLPNKNAKYTLLVSHGNAEDIGHMLPFLKEFRDEGFAVFAYDYDGYGTSTGRPTEAHTYADIQAAYDYLVNELKVSPQRIIVYGRSVGAAVAIDLAAKVPVAALIIESPFVSAYRVMTHIPLLPFDKFNNLKKITKVRYPMLIIHGTSDMIVPFWHGKKLYDSAAAPKDHYWVKGAGHNNLFIVAGDHYWEVVRRFVKRHLSH